MKFLNNIFNLSLETLTKIKTFKLLPFTTTFFIALFCANAFSMSCEERFSEQKIKNLIENTKDTKTKQHITNAMEGNVKDYIQLLIHDKLTDGKFFKNHEEAKMNLEKLFTTDSLFDQLMTELQRLLPQSEKVIPKNFKQIRVLTEIFMEIGAKNGKDVTEAELLFITLKVFEYSEHWGNKLNKLIGKEVIKIEKSQGDEYKLEISATYNNPHDEAVRLFKETIKFGLTKTEEIIGRAPEVEVIIEKLQILAEENPHIKAVLAEVFDEGIGVEKDPIEARRLYIEAAKQGDLGAIAKLHEWATEGKSNIILILAQMYDQGNGVPKNPDEANRLYIEAAKLGEPRAITKIKTRAEKGNDPVIQFEFAEILETGTGVKRSRREAKKLYIQAAKLGESRAIAKLQEWAEEGKLDVILILAKMYDQGIGVPENPDEANRLYIQAAKLGNPRAIAKIKTRAKNGDSYMQFVLAQMYEQGIGVPKNPDEANRLYIQAAKLGNPRAIAKIKTRAKNGDSYMQFVLAQMYEQGIGVPKNPDEANRLYIQAAKLGENRAIAKIKTRAENGDSDMQVVLAKMYDQGIGVPENPDEANRLYIQAAKLGEPNAITELITRAKNGDSDMQVVLAEMYDQGIRVPENPDAANRLYIQAAKLGENRAIAKIKTRAKNGDSDMQFVLAEMYDAGIGVPKNPDEVAELLIEAVKNGHPGATFKLAEMYDEGRVVAKDTDKAKRLYIQAAKLGEPKAITELITRAKNGDSYMQVVLAEMYDQGIRVLENPDEANRLYIQAAKLGEPKAITKLITRAKNGDSDMQVVLAKMYDQGNGVPKNPDAANRLYIQAAKLGNPRAITELITRAKNGDSYMQVVLAEMYDQGIGVEKDPIEANKWYIQAAKLGENRAIAKIRTRVEQGNDPDIIFEFAQMLEQGRVVAKDTDKSNTLYIQAAKLGEPRAIAKIKTRAENGDSDMQVVLAKMYDQGIGVPENPDEANRLYIQAAKLGEPNAITELITRAKNGDSDMQVVLAEIYETGTGVDPDTTEAAKWYLEATKLGENRAIAKIRTRVEQGNDPDIIFEFAQILDQGIKIKKDSEEAKKLYIEAAKLGEPRAIAKIKVLAEQGNDPTIIFALAKMYEEGTWIKQNLETAAELFYKVTQQENPEFILDTIRAQRELEHLAEQGVAHAQFLIGEMYSNSEHFLSSKEPYIKATENGHPDAPLRLAVMFEKGQGVEKDSSEAAKWRRIAAENGNPHAIDQLRTQARTITRIDERNKYSKFELANLYRSGKGGIEQNSEEAARSYRELARAGLRVASRKLQEWATEGNKYAQFQLGEMYYNGEGEFPPNYAKAFEQYRLAAKQGLVEAGLKLAKMYAKGLGVKKDPIEAMNLYQKLFERGVAEAQFELGLIYKNGVRSFFKVKVKKDLRRAIHSFSLAAKQRYQGAKSQLNSLAENYPEAREALKELLEIEQTQSSLNTP